MANRTRSFIKEHHIWWLALLVAAIGIGLATPFINPIFPVVGVLFVVNLIVIMKYPTWGLLLYLFVFLYRPGEVYPALNALRLEFMLGGFVLVVLVLHQLIRTGKIKLPTDRTTLWLAGFMVVMALSIITSFEKTQTFEMTKEFLKTLVFYYLIVALIVDRKRFVAFISVFVLMIGKIAFDALKLYMSGGFVHTMGVDRLTGTTSAGGDPNALAATMAISIPVAVAAALYFRSKLVQLGLWGLSAGMVYLIAITGSRGGLLAFLGVLVGAFLFARQKALVATVAIVVLVGGWFMLPDQYQDRYATLVDAEDMNDTSSGRIDIWEAGLSMIVNRPILGVGAGAFRWAAASGAFGYGRFMQAHNLFIQIAATTGLIGLFVWLAFAYNFYGRLRRILTDAPLNDETRWMTIFVKAFIVSLIALFVSGLFGHNLYRYNWYMLAGLTLALDNMLDLRLRRIANQEQSRLETAVDDPQTATAGA